MKRFLRCNALSIILFGLFAVILVAMSLVGHRQENTELITHGQPALSYLEYSFSGGFAEAVFENWQSEFLAVGALIALTIFLRQRHSPESKPIGAPNAKTGR